MSCEQARDAMLDAEPDELRGVGASALAAHVRECARCRAAAATLLGGTAALARALDDGVAARARDVLPMPVGARSRRARPALAAAIPLAAAAALALLFVGRGVLVRDRIGPYTPPVSVPSAPVVNAHGDGGVAVMNTADPRITVVWNF